MVKEYTKRVIICMVGLALCGLGSALGVLAGDVGTNAWNTLALGLQRLTQQSFGTCTFLVSLSIIVIDLLGRGNLGFGSLLNVIFVAYFSDFWLTHLDFLPTADSMALGLVYTLAGQFLMAFATLLYMIPALGCGPRDTLMVLIGKKVPKVPIGGVRFCIEAAALGVGLLLGAPFGLGTVLIMALQASIFQLACRVTNIEPRNIVHEDFAATFRRVGKAK